MLEAETGRLQSLNEQLKKNENVPGTEELRILYDKSRLYDDIKNNVSRLVSDARRKAAELIYEAEQSSRQIMADGVASLTEMQRRIRAMVRRSGRSRTATRARRAMSTPCSRTSATR